MKKLWLPLLILTTILVVSGCGSSSHNSKTSTCTLQVNSITDTSSQALSNVTVKVIGEGKTYTGKSDASGKVVINSIPVGTYIVSYALADKATTYTQMTLTAPTKILDQMRLMTWAETSAGFLAGATNSEKCNLMGAVVAADGTTPLSDVSISVSPAPDKFYYYDNSSGSIVLNDTASTTDGTGRFFVLLSNGTYTITASDSSHTFDPIVITVTEPCLFKNFTIKAK